MESRTVHGMVSFAKRKVSPGHVEDLPAFVNEPQWEDPGEVQFITTDYWQWYRDQTPRFFAMFYAPWCGHCKSFKPAYIAASQELAGQMPLVAVDCTADEEICTKMQVQGYPTLLYFDTSLEAGHEKYGEGRTQADLVSWLQAKLEKGEGEAPVEEEEPGPYVNNPQWGEDSMDVWFVTAKHWATFRQEHPLMFVMFHAPWCEHCQNTRPIFAEVSTFMSDDMALVAVDCTTDKELCTREGAEGYPTFLYYGSSTGKPESYSNKPVNVKSIVKFLSKKVAQADLKEEL